MPLDKQAKNGLIVLMVISPKSQEELGLLPLSAVRKEEVWNWQIHWVTWCPCWVINRNGELQQPWSSKGKATKGLIPSSKQLRIAKFWLRETDLERGGERRWPVSTSFSAETVAAAGTTRKNVRASALRWDCEGCTVWIPFADHLGLVQLPCCQASSALAILALLL